MDWSSEKRRDALAADYVLGLLQGTARRRFERRMTTDRDLERRVMELRGRLDPLLEALPVEPAPAVWRRIEARLNPPVPRYSRRLRLSLGAAALAMLAVIGFLVAHHLRSPPVNSLATAFLHNAHGKQVASVQLGANGRSVTVRVLHQLTVPFDRSLELWALTRSGRPVPVGLLPTKVGASRGFRLTVPRRKLQGFAVSVEPPGGAPGPRPTGPIIYHGDIATLAPNGPRPNT